MNKQNDHLKTFASFLLLLLCIYMIIVIVDNVSRLV
jgi:hypothetical protein